MIEQNQFLFLCNLPQLKRNCIQSRLDTGQNLLTEHWFRNSVRLSVLCHSTFNMTMAYLFIDLPNRQHLCHEKLVFRLLIKKIKISFPSFYSSCVSYWEFHFFYQKNVAFSRADFLFWSNYICVFMKMHQLAQFYCSFG